MGKARGHRGREYVVFTVDDEEGHRFWGLSEAEAFHAIMANIDYAPVWTQESDKLVLTFTYAAEPFKDTVVGTLRPSNGPTRFEAPLEANSVLLAKHYIMLDVLHSGLRGWYAATIEHYEDAVRGKSRNKATHLSFVSAHD